MILLYFYFVTLNLMLYTLFFNWMLNIIFMIFLISIKMRSKNDYIDRTYKIRESNIDIRPSQQNILKHGEQQGKNKNGVIWD